MPTLWGVFGAIWFLFASTTWGRPGADRRHRRRRWAASFIGAAVAERSTRRWGVGPVAIAAMLLASVGQRADPARAGRHAARRASRFLLGQQLVADAAMTRLRRDRDVRPPGARRRIASSGRVAATFQVGSAGAQLVAAIGAGLLAEVIGLRATSFLAPLGGLLAAAILVLRRRSVVSATCRSWTVGPRPRSSSTSSAISRSGA